MRNGDMNIKVKLFIREYALVERDTKCCPYVVVSLLKCNKDGTCSWLYGHYFETYEHALLYLCKRVQEDLGVA